MAAGSPLDPIFDREEKLTRAELSAHVEDATADSKQRIDHIQKETHMIVELGKVSEETKAIDPALPHVDEASYSYQ